MCFHTVGQNDSLEQQVWSAKAGIGILIACDCEALSRDYVFDLPS